ncbi:golgin IMH1-like [Crotalus tigris]|uniref:golgin IMH1-like n=1 Tax=Crotalus tigris TaxID=88082 RepID=UPI00192F3C72|nr:golgin IMH1-like [Crotalus tigris]
MHVGHEEPAGHDLSFKIRSHQILQTKAQRLEIDLKRAREQSYIKTMEISKLLTEKEALELKIQELINENLQLTREKEELCTEYEEKLSRKNSSDESIKLDKLRQENQSLSCKVLKYAGEKTELLRENNDLKDELYRKITVMSKLLSEKEELRIKAEMLVFKNLELTDEKELLCRAYEERLCREKQLRKGCCTLLMDKDQMVSPNSREYKRGFVNACQTSAVIIEDNSEALEKMKPQVVEYQLKEQWLKASVDSLKIKKSKGARQNILRWLQQTLENLKEDSAKLSRDTLAEWLKASLINLQEGCEWLVEREDVNGWLKVSISHLQEEGPDTCDLEVQEWIEASIIGIQHLQKFESESRGRLRKGWFEKSIENLKNQCPEGFVNILEWLQGSLESLLVSEKPRPVLEKWFQQSLKNLQEEGPGTSKQDAKKWLEISIKNLEEEGPKTPHLDIQEWLEASIKAIQGLQKSKIKRIFYEIQHPPSISLLNDKDTVNSWFFH